ncbi:hypothetical protein EJB05_51621, partial [Eragrostis curvula]
MPCRRTSEPLPCRCRCRAPETPSAAALPRPEPPPCRCHALMPMSLPWAAAMPPRCRPPLHPGASAAPTQLPLRQLVEEREELHEKTQGKLQQQLSARFNTTMSFSSMVGTAEKVEFYGHSIVDIAPTVYGHPHARISKIYKKAYLFRCSAFYM